MHVFMAVTPDKYELPITVEDMAGKLARTLKVKEDTIYTGVRRKWSGRIIGMKFIKVELEE